MPSFASEQRSELDRGLAALGLDLDQQATDALLKHLALLRQWNRTYNLVAGGALSSLLSLHLLDSLAILPWLGPGPLLDVGTGAGFPGMPIAITEPARQVWLLDSTGKKIRFLNHVVRTLGLQNVTPVKERVERFSPEQEFSTITSRALGSLQHFAQGCRHLAGPETRLLAMKGQPPETELDALPDWVNVEAVQRLEVPGLNAERHLVVMSVSS